MSKHALAQVDEVAVPAGTPTQVANPKRTTLRTIIQSIVGVVVAVFTAILALLVFAPEVLDELAAVLPPEWVAWLSGAVAIAGLWAGAITRIMAIPGVAQFIRDHLSWLAPIKPVEDDLAALPRDRTTYL